MSSLSLKLPSRPILLLISSAVFLSACGHEPVKRLPGSAPNNAAVQPGKTGPRHSLGQKAASEAVRQIGAPYRYGGTTANGFDCSGLAQYAYAHAGKRIPRTTAQQWQQLAPVAKNNLQVGDLLFFRIDGRISHVGLYLGKSRFVHAPSTGREVSIAELDSEFYRRAFVRGGRPD